MVHRKSEVIHIKRGNSYGEIGVWVWGEGEGDRDGDFCRGPEPAGFQGRRKSNLLGPGKDLLP